LSIVNQKLFMRPWPKPGEPLATAKMLDKVGVTKTLPQELSMGPDCEFGGWSYKRIAQPGNKTFVLGISPDKTVYFELPSTVVNTSPMACSGERVVVEAINPVDKLASLVTCAHDGVCIPPDNRPFLKPWAEAHERTLGIAMTPRGTIAMQALKSPTRWALSVSISSDGGKIYDLERKVGEGTGDRGRLELGALVGFGERTMMLLSADVTGTTRRAWFLMASDDGGQTWNPP
jgi:hypothetical protein